MSATPDQTKKGQCLCGAVTVSARLTDTTLQACHCRQCQQWTGGGPLYSIRARNVAVDGEENVRAYHASDWGERAFCEICGSTLYWRLKGRSIAFLAPGLFDQEDDWEVREELFVDHRPGWLPPWPNAKQHDEAEMKAQLDAFLKGDSA